MPGDRANVAPPVVGEETAPEPDRLSAFAEVLGVNALHCLDTKDLGRLAVCARAFGKEDSESGRSLCGEAAWRRLRADRGFRRTDNRNKGRMPIPSDWRGRTEFPGWIRVLDEWEAALAHGRTGGNHIPREAVDFEPQNVTFSQRIENERAAVYMRMKFVLGHFEPRNLAMAWTNHTPRSNARGRGRHARGRSDQW